MTVSKRQFTLLQEMGINVWQQKNKLNSQDNSALQTPPEEVTAKSNDNINLKDLIEQQLFKDIIQSIGLSIGEVTLEESYVNIGLVNWHFSTDNELSLKNNLLTTPYLQELAKSTVLKNKLWQLLQSQALT